MLKSKILIFLLCCVPVFAKAFDGGPGGTGTAYGTAANWDLDTLPANGDDVTIGAGFDVTLDSDQSAAAIASLTINGSLTMASTSDCQLNVAGVIGGTGSLLCGTSSVPLPAASSAYIDLSDTDSTINSSTLDVQLYCWQPSRLYTTLAANWTSGTDFTVDDDVSDWDELRDEGMSLYIRVDEAKNSDAGSTEYLVTGISADGLTISVSAFDDVKSSGDTVVLITRNIQIEQTNAGATSDLVEACKAYSVFGAELRPDSDRFAFDDETVTMSGTISGCDRGFSSSPGTVSGTISGCQYGLIYSSGTVSGTISGCKNGLMYSSGTVSGTIRSCQYGITYSFGTITGTISDCSFGLYRSSGTITGTISGCSSALYQSCATGYGATLLSNTSNNSGYDRLGPLECTMIYDSSGTPGGFLGYTQGGVITNDSAANGFDPTYTHTKDSTDNICYRQVKTQIPPGSTLSVTGIMKVTQDHTGYIPRLEIVDISDDPIVGGTALDTANLATYDGTDTSWQGVSASYTNTTDYVKDVYIRVSSSTADADLYESFRYSFSGGSGGWGARGGSRGASYRGGIYSGK